MKRILLAVCLSVFSVGVGATAEERLVISSEYERVSWIRNPRINFNNNDLQGYDRTISVHIVTYTNGSIASTKIMKSSGLESIDKKIVMAIKRSRITPYLRDGTYYPVSFTQPFNMMLSRDAQYENRPVITVKKSDLQGRDRTVNVYAEADDNGKVTKAVIKDSSGLKELDSYVLSEYRRQAKFKPLTINGKPYPITKTERFDLNLKDVVE